MTAGHIYTVAGDGARGTAGDGGPALKAGLHSPGGVAVDHAGNLAIADSRNRRVQVVAATSGTFYGQAMTAGDVYTVASLGDPSMVAVDGAGNVVITSADGRQGVRARGEHGHVLRPGDDRGEPVRRGRRRQATPGRRRPGAQRRAAGPDGGGGGPRGQPGDR